MSARSIVLVGALSITWPSLAGAAPALMVC